MNIKAWIFIEYDQIIQNEYNNLYNLLLTIINSHEIKTVMNKYQKIVLELYFIKSSFLIQLYLSKFVVNLITYWKFIINI